MTRLGRFSRVAVLTLAAVSVVMPVAPAGASQGWEPPRPGAADLGDRLFPGLGNGGYDALHYDLRVRYATSDPAQAVSGTVTMWARATHALSRLNLDFAGQSVGAVWVGRRPAPWRWEGEELVVTPKRPIRKGERFQVRVTDFTAVPTAFDPEDESSIAFLWTPDGTSTAPQPDFAHEIYPSNDHPRDKASFTFALDVPSELVAVANGVLAHRSTRHGRTTWRYVQRQPMATQLTQLAVGRYDLTHRGIHRGVVVRDVTAPSLTAFVDPKLALELGHLDWMLAAVGGYPFDAYGSLVVDSPVGFALETQSLSFFGRSWFTVAPQGLWDPTMLHELAHQWFGNSVSVWEWSDLWLSEGHASWYEFLYAEERGLLDEDTVGWPNETGYADFDELMRAVYALGDQWRAQWGPVAQPRSGDFDVLFSFNAYHGGALVLYALREEIGEAAFERVERAWLGRYRHRSASTADFIELASRVAGRDLSQFLTAWLYGDHTPPMPNHPDWTVLPVEPAAVGQAREPVTPRAAPWRR